MSCTEYSFEQSLEQLEAVVRKLEEGQLGLTDALAAYEAGVKHLRHCYAALENAERKIELLTGIDAAGNPVTRPFDEEQQSLPEKAQSRSRRRSAQPEQAALPEPAMPSRPIEDDARLF